MLQCLEIYESTQINKQLKKLIKSFICDAYGIKMGTQITPINLNAYKF